MIWESVNRSFKDMSEFELLVKDGDSFAQCWFVRENPNTPVFVGKSNLSFLDCNLINCLLPNGSETYQCNTAQNEYEFQTVEEIEAQL